MRWAVAGRAVEPLVGTPCVCDIVREPAVDCDVKAGIGCPRWPSTHLGFPALGGFRGGCGRRGFRERSGSAETARLRL